MKVNAITFKILNSKEDSKKEKKDQRADGTNKNKQSKMVALTSVILTIPLNVTLKKSLAVSHKLNTIYHTIYT